MTGTSGGWMDRFKDGLRRTRESVSGRLQDLLHRGPAVGEEFYEELESILIQADFGVEAAEELVQDLKRETRERKLSTADEIRQVLKEEIKMMLEVEGKPTSDGTGPVVLMFVGVNGTGKTTTVGKLAYHLSEQGHTVVLAAADTFRAAAVEQLQVWGERSGAEVISHEAGGDPGAVAFDALQAALARKADYLLVDTAGRLHTKANLMEELKKVKRVMSKIMPGAPHEVLLVLDATTGQNALSQAEQFHAALGLTGLVLTKLDGTAKGGIVAAVTHRFHLPVKYVGLGEGPEDLRPFDPQAFVDAIWS